MATVQDLIDALNSLTPEEKLLRVGFIDVDGEDSMYDICLDITDEIHPNPDLDPEDDDANCHMAEATLWLTSGRPNSGITICRTTGDPDHFMDEPDEPDDD